jgi:diguanylate cyclase (GGDEF)-like protein/putative nucleotidyltransferase with HDIG domain
MAALEASADAVGVLEAAAGPGGGRAFRVAAVNPRWAQLVGVRAGRTLAPGLADGAVASLAALCDDALTGGAPRADQARVGGPDDAVEWVDRRVVPLSETEVAVTVRDVTQPRRSEEAVRRDGAESLALAAEQAALRRVAEAVARDASPETVTAVVTAEAARLFDADTARVLRFDEEAIVVVGTYGPGAPPVGTGFPRAGGRATAQVAGTGRTARVDDYAALRRADPVSAEVVPSDFGSGIAAPISAGARLWGGLLVVRLEGGAPFTHGDESRLERFAELVGLAVSNGEAARRLRALAATDPLTGLANHRAFQERLAQEVARARRYERPLALVLLDLDHFKRVNDAHGHQAGDAVLAEVARRLSAAARGADLVARVGGEEFAWLLPDTDPAGALALAERMRHAVEILPFPGVGGLTASLGVAGLDREGDGQDLFRRADLALIWAKLSGRNRSADDTPELAARLAGRRAELGRGEEQERMPAIRALATLLDATSPHRLRHSERVAGIAEAIAERLGWSEQRRAALREAALIHDVGTAVVPEEILGRPGRLTPEERERMRAHAPIGAEIARRALSSEQAAWVRAHHERWDGRGYPDGLAGEDIPEGARILAVADAWEAMTSPRAHRPARGVDEAAAELQAGSGTQFWPTAVAALASLASEGRAA